MAIANKIIFGDNLVVTDEGSGTIRVDGVGLHIESFTVTAAQIIAAFDVLLSGSYVECLALNEGDVVLSNWYASTLNVGDISSLKLGPSGLSSMDINNVPDEEIQGSTTLTTLGTYTYQTPFAGIVVNPVHIVSDCAGYVLCSNGPPSSGQITVYVLIQRAL